MDKKSSKKISDKVFDRIKKDEVKPIPKWQFVLKNGFLWLLLAILIGGAAIALGITLLQWGDIEWDLRPILGLGLGQFILTVFPYFWLIILSLVGVLAYFNFMATPKGYRYPKYQIILFGVLIVILTGAAVRYLGFARNIHDRILEGAPQFKHLIENKEDLYNLPEKGLLAGTIIEYDNTTVVVESFDGRQWQVDIEDLKLPTEKQLDEGQKIKLLGELTGEDSFKANEARPWHRGDALQIGERKQNGLGKKNGAGPPPTPPPIDEEETLQY